MSQTLEERRKRDRERHKVVYDLDPDKHRKRKKRTHFHRYGITKNDYDRMYEKQRGRCAICGTHQSELKRRLAVDHDHKTNEIRGLLCPKCNLMLGYACDEVPTLVGAIQYLQRS